MTPPPKEPFIDWRRNISAARVFLAALHLGIGIMSFYRPTLTTLVPGYAAFHEIAPTVIWGMWAFMIGLGLILLPRANPLLILWQFASATYFTLFVILVTDGPYGPTWGTIAYGVPALWSVVLAYITTDDWFRRTRWPQRSRVWLEKWWRCKRGPPNG